jgi:hypothetical protein
VAVVGLGCEALRLNLELELLSERALSWRSELALDLRLRERAARQPLGELPRDALELADPPEQERQASVGGGDPQVCGERERGSRACGDPSDRGDQRLVELVQRQRGRVVVRAQPSADIDPPGGRRRARRPSRTLAAEEIVNLT